MHGEAIVLKKTVKASYYALKFHPQGSSYVDGCSSYSWEGESASFFDFSISFEFNVSGFDFMTQNLILIVNNLMVLGEKTYRKCTIWLLSCVSTSGRAGRELFNFDYIYDKFVVIPKMRVQYTSQLKLFNWWIIFQPYLMIYLYECMSNIINN